MTNEELWNTWLQKETPQTPQTKTEIAKTLTEQDVKNYQNDIEIIIKGIKPLNDEMSSVKQNNNENFNYNLDLDFHEGFIEYKKNWKKVRINFDLWKNKKQTWKIQSCKRSFTSDIQEIKTEDKVQLLEWLKNLLQYNKKRNA